MRAKVRERVQSFQAPSLGECIHSDPDYPAAHACIRLKNLRREIKASKYQIDGPWPKAEQPDHRSTAALTSEFDPKPGTIRSK